MRLSSTLRLGSIALVSTVVAAARHGVMHIPRIIDPTPSTTLSPSDARLVLAQRLGLSQYHSLDDANDNTLDAINHFGVQSDPFTILPSDLNKPKLLLVVEGIDNPEAFLPTYNRDYPTLKIDNPPSADDTARFLKDLAAQQQQTYTRPTPGYDTNCTSYDIDSCLESWINAVRYTGAQPPLHHSRTLPDFVKPPVGTHDGNYITRKIILRDALHRHLVFTPNYIDITILLLPLPAPPPSLFDRFRGVKKPTWGSYKTVGAAANGLKKRQDQGLQDISSSSSSTQSASPSTSTSSPHANAEETSPPKGILPTCYISESACTETTHSCSGHGSCKKLYTMPDSPDQGKDCWACACEPSTSGDKRILWAGPACQKKDVSVSFWLLAGSSVALMSAVAWGIGLLVEMGRHELPSVLGAGVTGPGARGK